MKANPRFLIPEGTAIRTRNVQRELRLRSHVTRCELLFDERICTGDGGTLCYFESGDWLICVESDQVIDIQGPAINTK